MAGSYPAISVGIVSSAGIITLARSYPPQMIISLPAPDCGMRYFERWRVGSASGGPIVCDWVVLPPVFKALCCHQFLPNDHFTASQNCCVILRAWRRVGGASEYPIIRC